MKMYPLKVVLVLFGILFLSACLGSQFHHEYIMRGQVVGVDDDEVTICVGRKDGAEPGQVLSVYRIVYGDVRSPEGYGVFERKYIGDITIESIIDEHFANASTSNGDVRKHDIFELKQ